MFPQLMSVAAAMLVYKRPFGFMVTVAADCSKVSGTQVLWLMLECLWADSGYMKGGWRNGGCVAVRQQVHVGQGWRR